MTLGQIPILCALTLVGGLMLSFEWFEGLFETGGEAILLPLVIGAVLAIPVAVAVLAVLGLDLVRARTGRRVWVNAIEHILAAALGAVVFVEGWAWLGTGAPDFSPAGLLAAYPLFYLVLIAIYWPRLAFRSPRAPTPASPR